MTTNELNKQFLDHKEGLHAYLSGFLKDVDAARDILQDLYLKVWEKRRTISSETARYYFYRAARNLCIDYFRKKREYEPEFTFAYENSPQQDYDKEELSRLFREAVNRLPSGYREVIFLKDVCGMETDDVVQITKWTANNVRVNLSRARKIVREELEKIYNFKLKV